MASQKQLTATWLSLAAILIAQLNPPSYSVLVKAQPNKDSEILVANVLPILLQCGLTALSVPGAMEAVSSLSSFLPALSHVLYVESRHRAGVLWLHGQSRPGLHQSVLHAGSWTLGCSDTMCDIFSGNARAVLSCRGCDVHGVFFSYFSHHISLMYSEPSLILFTEVRSNMSWFPTRMPSSRHMAGLSHERSCMASLELHQGVSCRISSRCSER